MSKKPIISAYNYYMQYMNKDFDMPWCKQEHINNIYDTTEKHRKYPAFIHGRCIGRRYTNHEIQELVNILNSIT